MSVDIYKEMVDLRERGEGFVLATIVRTSGSTPRKAGTKMLFLPGGKRVSTLGGGVLEDAVAKKAKEVMEDGMPVLLSVDLSQGKEGHPAGGLVDVFLEPVTPPRTVVILGAGNVGLAVASASLFAGFEALVLDDRPEQLAKVPSGCRKRMISRFKGTLSGLDVRPETMLVIATRSHETDLEALKEALSSRAAYIGLLGSRKKRDSFFKRLLSEGYEERELRKRVRVPVGLPIGALTPEEIAISIVAELIEFSRKGEVRG